MGHEAEIWVICRHVDKRSALMRLLDGDERDLIGLEWLEAETRMTQPRLIVTDRLETPEETDALRRLRTRISAPVVLIVDSFQKLHLPTGLADVDVAPMIPDVVAYKVDLLLAHSAHQQALAEKVRLMEDAHQRLEREAKFHRETERILRENEQTLRRIFRSIEATNEAILLTDRDEIVYYANPAFEKLSGYDLCEVFGAKATEYFEFHHAGLTFDEMKQIALETDCWQGDVTLRREDRTLYQAFLDVNAVRSQKGEFEGYAIIQRDITTLKKLMGELEVLARYDSLTGLFNRRHFMEKLEGELQRSSRYPHPLSLLLMDLDHFKKINDTYGHATGDRVLAEFGKIAMKAMRNTDFAGRWGGEEFCIALPETDLEGAVIFANRVLEALAECRFETDDGIAFHATCSAGAVVLGDDHESLELEMQKVDEALYRAKRGGRNRVEVYEPHADGAVTH